MKTIFAILMATWAGTAFAQNSPCLPGGVCCTNGFCGTLEQFQRRAKIICLKADAIENKSLSQSIEWSGYGNVILAGFGADMCRRKVALTSAEFASWKEVGNIPMQRTIPVCTENSIRID
jgi:hypothetical protein